jgi:hypothetical protein
MLGIIRDGGKFVCGHLLSGIWKELIEIVITISAAEFLLTVFVQRDVIVRVYNVQIHRGLLKGTKYHLFY